MFIKRKKYEKKVAKKYILDDKTPFIIKEAYKKARANLIFALSTSEKKIITFTSSVPDEGKTTTCINMALTLADTGAKVLIMDADLRKPAIHKNFKLDNTKGLSNAISDQDKVLNVIKKNVRTNLDVITSGIIPPNPSELISSDKMKSIMDELEKEYDYICIDTPPINIISDALLLNPIVAGLFFVVKENSTTHKELQTALKNIEMTNGKVLGFLKNACVGELSSRKSYKKKYNIGYDYSYENSDVQSTEPQTI